MTINVKTFTHTACITGLLFLSEIGFAQIRIISSSFSSYNVSPENLCSINISGGSAEFTGIIEAKITNMQGKEIIKATSNSFALKNGVYNTAQLGIKINSINYQNSALSEYIKLYHQIPSGKYNYSVVIKLSDGSSDELSEDIESESSSFLSLISPTNKDTLESFNPLLIWTHQESFNLTQQGEYFKMILTEIKSDQSAEAAINVNSAIFQPNFLTRHDILYPYDAPKLIPGNRYAWQVQKVANGVITNKTEAWEFVMKNSGQFLKSFVEITPKLNTNPYVVQNDKLYFVYNEEYASSLTEIPVIVIDAKGKEHLANAHNYVVTGIKKEELKNIINNSYELDLLDLNLKQGHYILKILNKKNQEYLLKFQYNL